MQATGGCSHVRGATFSVCVRLPLLLTLCAYACSRLRMIDHTNIPLSSRGYCRRLAGMLVAATALLDGCLEAVGAGRLWHVLWCNGSSCP
jgi:hypothetical protein